MKKLVIASIVLAAGFVHATKARLISLQGADHLVDTQTVLVNPAHIDLLNQYITFEMGTPGSNAEGGFSKKLSNGNRIGVYLGHDNSNELRTGAPFIKQRNPVEVIYGMGNMAFSGSVSTTDDKKNDAKETTLVGKFGMVQNNWELYTHLTLLANAEKPTAGNKLNSAPQIKAGGAVNVDDNRYFGGLTFGQYKQDPGGTTIKDMGAILGWLNRSLKSNETDIYFGARIEYNQKDYSGPKITKTGLPLFIGVETPVTTWAIFRASAAQNFIFGETKDEVAGTPAEAVASNSTVSAGLGLKWGQLSLDGALTAATSGNINGNSFISNAGVSYWF